MIPCGYLGAPKGTINSLAVHQCNRFGRSCTVEPTDRILSCAGCLSFIEGPPPPSVDVIITSHNYGHFLDECLDSVDCTGQLIVVDDASDTTDKTKAICARRGVKYLRTEHRNPHLARGAGFAICKSPLVCFLDADNTHQAGYLDSAAKLFAGNPRLGIVYANLQLFGDSEGLTNFPATVDRSLMERQNHCDTNSVWSAEALKQVNTFRSAPAGYEDWRMARDLLRSGEWEAVLNPIPVNYRRHSGQITQSGRYAAFFDDAAMADETVTIFTTFSERIQKDPSLWNRRKAWLRVQQWPRVRLIVANTSHEPMPDGWMDGLPKMEGVSLYDHPAGDSPGLETATRFHGGESKVQTAVASIYNRMLREANTEYVLVLEDDVFPERADAIEALMRSFARDTPAVSGAYRQRFGPQAWTCWSGIPDDGNPKLRPHAGHGIETVGGIAFGCVLIRRSQVQHEVLTGNTRQTIYYDADWWQRLGTKPRINWDVRCDHVGPKSEPIGDHVHAILTECGITRPACGECTQWQQRMNAWGVAGCTEHRAEILARLNVEAKSASWLESIGVASRGYLSTGMILDEAIRRAK